MKQKLLDELMEVSEEEQKYLDGQGVAQGSITHCIEGKELVLHKGDVFQAI